ncbi:MAG: serine/threonine protein kinase [Burkholderiales bacterium]
MALQAVSKLGRYHIIRELSEGAMGTVFEAIDPLIERTVAIKTIKLDFSKEELADFEQRFLREAKSAGRLNHPNIVTIYDVGEADNVAYLAMEYLEGETLREVMDSGVALSVGRAVWIAAQIAEALSYAEEHGVVHRDVKPANIIITRRGAVKLTDFGIALLPMGSRTQSGMVMGSPKYMSPEQALGHTVDSRSDLFSLGVVLYEMLTGRPPFDGDNLNAILYRVMNEEPAPPRSVNARIPPGLSNIILKMMEKKPQRRYASAGQLARELKLFQTSPAAAATAANSEMTVDAGAATMIVGARPAATRKNIAIYAAIGAAVLSFAAAAVWLPREERPLPQAPVLPAPRLEAVKPPEARKETPVVASTLSPLETAQESVAVEPPLPEKLPEVAAAGPALATLSFAIVPWGEIYVDSKKIGVSPPMNKLKVPAGRHKVEIRNTHFVPYSETIVVKPDATKKIRHKFQ